MSISVESSRVGYTVGGVGMPRRISSAKLCVINCFERILDYD